MEYEYDDFDEFPRYVSAAKRRDQAKKRVSQLKSKGKVLQPVVVLASRKIATSFWGHAWCRAMEQFQDMDHRLDRGRSYVRNGAVVDLKIDGSKVQAEVSGSELYRVTIEFSPLSPKRWKTFVQSAAGEVASLLDLLAGKLPQRLLQQVIDSKKGLFPKPAEISYDCSCPDYANLCKHIAATMYGIGVRFDSDSNLFFALRGVNPADLIRQAGNSLASEPEVKMDDQQLSELFDIELESTPKNRKK